VVRLAASKTVKSAALRGHHALKLSARRTNTTGTVCAREQFADQEIEHPVALTKHRVILTAPKILIRQTIFLAPSVQQIPAKKATSRIAVGKVRCQIPVSVTMIDRLALSV